METCRRNVIETFDNNVTIFVTAERATDVSQDYFSQINYYNFCICWINPNC